jgi:hypothetical protein
VIVQLRVGGNRARLPRRDDPARPRVHRPGDTGPAAVSRRRFARSPWCSELAS